MCHHFPNGPPTGRIDHPYTIAGHSSRALRGQGEITHRNHIPARLLGYLLTNTGNRGWFLGLCSGYQANRAVVELHVLTYVAVNIAKFFKLGSGPDALLATANLVANLVLIDQEDSSSEYTANRDTHPTTSSSSGSPHHARPTLTCKMSTEPRNWTQPLSGGTGN